MWQFSCCERFIFWISLEFWIWILKFIWNLAFGIWNLICQFYYQWKDRTNKYWWQVAAVVGTLSSWELFGRLEFLIWILNIVCYLFFEIWDLILYPCQFYHQREDRTNKYWLYVAVLVGKLNDWNFLVFWNFSHNDFTDCNKNSRLKKFLLIFWIKIVRFNAKRDKMILIQSRKV